MLDYSNPAGYSCNVINHNSTCNDKIANPYLMTVSDRYLNAKIKIMILGQETKGWGGEFGNVGAYCPNNSILMLQQLYDLFVNNSHKTGYFWNFCNTLQRNHPEVGFIYNNVGKFGFCDAGGHPSDYHLRPRVLSEEILITHPDAVIFLSGPNYDEEINDNWGSNLQFGPYCPNLPIRKIAKINGITIPAIRTYHPHYLCRQKLIAKLIQTEIDSFINSLRP